MPHEVIMPALGMAQDTGLIVSWLKSPGDAVTAGEALLEVETDKATMEVEAAHDGFLSDVRFDAGQEVPVGEVIAKIVASADAVADATPEEGASQEDTAALPPGGPPSDAALPAGKPSDAALPAGREIIMPALGMAQDSGRILAWHKTPGEAVRAADILFEVETDKATMEVEAGHDGYLAATLGHAGEDVPVGQPVAIIASDKPDTPIARGVAESPPTVAAAGIEAGSAGTTPPAPTQSCPGGRILASPKAKRLARERGLDLSGLVELGVEQPFHAADIETLAAAPAMAAVPADGAKTSAPAAMEGGGAIRTEVTAAAPAGALIDLLAWAAAETGASVPRAGVLAAFAAAALRAARSDDAPLTIRCAGLQGAALYTDPDRAGLGALTEGDADAGTTPDLTLRDLSATRLTGARLAQAPDTLIVVAGETENTLELRLSADPAALSDDGALALLDGMAQRLADPMRHLL